MQEEALVTVVIPCYKQEQYLPYAIESVLKQTYDHREIIIVDDGSDSVRRAAARYPDVRVVRQENRGLGAARNTGIHGALGNSIVFLDADDTLLPDALSTGVNLLKSDARLGFVAGLTKLVADDGTPIPTVYRSRPANDYYLNLLKCNITTGIHAVMFRRAALDEIGGFDTTGKYAGVEDYDVYLRIVRQRPILYHDNILGEYRQHAASMSRDYAMMMRSAIQLLDGHKNTAPTPAVADAAQTGISVFKEYYTDLMTRRMKSSLLSGSWSTLSRDLKDIAQIYPLALTKLVSKRAYRWLANLSDEVVDISGIDDDLPLELSPSHVPIRAERVRRKRKTRY